MAIQFVNNLDLNNNYLEEVAIENLQVDPSDANSVEGKIYYNTSTDKLRLYTGAGWVNVGPGVDSVTTTDGTFINLTPNSPTAGDVTVTADLSATGSPSNTTFLRGDNVWATPSGAYTSWSLEADAGTAVNITDGLRVDFTGATGITTTVASGTPNTLTIDLDDTSVTPGSYTYASITVDQQGRLTAASSGTAPSTPSDATITLTGGNGLANNGGAFTLNQASNETITFTVGEGAGITVNANDVAIDYLGPDNVILAAADGTSVTLADTDDFLFADSSASGDAKYANLSQLKTYIGADNYGSWTLDGDTGTPQDIDSGNTATFVGGTNINTVVNSPSGDNLTINLDPSVTLSGTLTVQSSAAAAVDITGKAQSAATTGSDPDATLTTKGYVDGLVSGGLTFKGTFRADSGLILSGDNNGSYIYNCPGGAGTRVAVAVGDYYVVATAGGSFYCSGDTLDIGDSIIGVDTAAADSSTSSDWSIVQSDEGVVSFTNANGTYVSASTQNTNATGAVTMGTIDLSAVNGNNTGSSQRFLTQANTWAVPAYTTNTDEKYTLNATQDGNNVDLNLTSDSGTDDSVVQLTAGSNITLTRNNASEITIASTDTGALGDRVSLTGGSTSGGITTFTYAVTSSFSGANAIDVKCEVITSSGTTVFADVTRSGSNLIVKFTGTVADGDYEVLLTYVG